MRRFFAISLCAATCFAAEYRASLKSGKPDLKSAGVMAFGPEGILLVGDSASGSVFAIDTGDSKANLSAAAVEVKGINEKIAGMLGTTPDQILINDAVVNPASKNTYISVSRGKGPDAAPVILRVLPSGKLEDFSLEKVKFSKVTLPNPPSPDAKDGRGQSKRQEAITDVAYVDGKVIIAGLSNEEFASNLRVVPFPFANADHGASVEIYHGQHGRFETASPVRTFVPYKIGSEQHILAAYTCTPIVKFPISSLKPGKKVMGTTIAELGNRNRPLDMVIYRKGGSDFILMNNSSRGVMKMSTAKVDSLPAITAQTEKQGLEYETLSALKGIQQLDLYDDARAMILSNDGGSMDLRTIALP